MDDHESTGTASASSTGTGTSCSRFSFRNTSYVLSIVYLALFFVAYFLIYDKEQILASLRKGADEHPIDRVFTDRASADSVIAGCAISVFLAILLLSEIFSNRAISSLLVKQSASRTSSNAKAKAKVHPVAASVATDHSRDQNSQTHSQGDEKDDVIEELPVDEAALNSLISSAFGSLHTPDQIIALLSMALPIVIIGFYASERGFVYTGFSFGIIHLFQAVFTITTTLRQLNIAFPVQFDDTSSYVLFVMLNVAAGLAQNGYTESVIPCFRAILGLFGVDEGSQKASTAINLVKMERMVAVIYVCGFFIALAFAGVPVLRHFGDLTQFNVVDANFSTYGLIFFGCCALNGRNRAFKLALLEIASKVGKLAAQAKAHEQSERNLRDKTMLVRFIAHETRTPLMIALSNIEFAKEDIARMRLHNKEPHQDLGVTESPAYDVEDLDAVSEKLLTASLACASASNIMDDVLSMETLSAGFSKFRPEFAAIVPQLQTLVNNCKVFGRASNVSLTFQVSQDMHAMLLKADDETDYGFCCVDMRKLEQIIRNLVINAVKFSSSGDSVKVVVGIANVPDQTVNDQYATRGVGNDSHNSSVHTIYDIEMGLRKDASTKASHVPPAIVVTHDANEWLPDGRLTIQVIDQGAGIAPENIGRLFKEQFAQFDVQRLQAGGGSGLGLWICRTLVQAHGGTIAVSSKGLLMGSTVEVTLPLFKRRLYRGNSNCFAREEPRKYHPERSLRCSVDSEGITPIVHQLGSNLHVSPAVMVSSHPEATHDPTYEMRPATMPTTMTIPAPQASSLQLDHSVKMTTNEVLIIKALVVDDSSACRKVVAEMLRRIIKSMNETSSTLPRISLEIQEADDDLTALRALKVASQQSTTFDVVFLDNVMKEIHGPETARVMRQEIGYRNKIVAVTGNFTDSSDLEVFKQAGVDAILGKPAKRTDLVDWLTRIIEERSHSNV